MATYARILLSGSTSGGTIPISGTNFAGRVTIHTAVAGATAFDEIYLWASNVTSAAALLTVIWGGTPTDVTDALVEAISIPANSPPIPIATGQVLNGAKVCSAFCPTASAINIVGYVNRIA